MTVVASSCATVCDPNAVTVRSATTSKASQRFIELLLRRVLSPPSSTVAVRPQLAHQSRERSSRYGLGDGSTPDRLDDVYGAHVDGPGAPIRSRERYGGRLVLDHWITGSLGGQGQVSRTQ